MASITVEVGQPYVVGFPALVGVRILGAKFAPKFEPNYRPAAVGFELRPLAAAGPPDGAPAMPEGAGDGLGGSRRVVGKEVRQLLDVATMRRVLNPGRYTLTVSASVDLGVIAAPPVELVFLAATPAELAERRRIFSLRPGVTFDLWSDVVGGVKRPIALAPAVRPRVREQLALHLFLAHAVTTPGPVSAVDPRVLAAATDPVVQSDVACHRVELAFARRDPSAESQASRAVAQHPGVATQIAAIRGGRGQIRDERSLAGRNDGP